MNAINKVNMRLNKIKMRLNELQYEPPGSSKQEHMDDICDETIQLLELLYKKRIEDGWDGTNPEPAYFEHRIDQYLWRHKHSFWVERGVFNNICINVNARVLELACGDGFFAHHFYSQLADSIECIDIEQEAIRYAKKYHSFRNKVQYYCEDILTYTPKNTYTNIIWDAAIEHFSPQDIHSIIKKYIKYLEPNGIFSGYTLQEKDTDILQHSDHLCEMKNKEHLASFFTPYFKNVLILETFSYKRVNYYFFASNGPLPLTLSDRNKYMLTSQ